MKWRVRKLEPHQSNDKILKMLNLEQNEEVVATEYHLERERKGERLFKSFEEACFENKPIESVIQLLLEAKSIYFQYFCQKQRTLMHVACSSFFWYA